MTDRLLPRDFIESGCVVRGVGALLLHSFIAAHREEWDRHTAPTHSSPLRGEVTSLELALEAAAEAHRETVSADASATGNGDTIGRVKGKHMMSTESAAEALGLSTRRIRQLLADGLLDGRSPAGRWEVSADSVAYLKESRDATAQ